MSDVALQWGAIVGAWLAAHHADSVLGLHVTLMSVMPAPGSDPMAGVAPDELAALGRMQQLQATGTGDQAIPSTKPQSPAYGLTDSPVGLAGWILETCARVWAEPQFQIVRWKTLPRGGHFAAMEVPELHVAELLAFTNQIGAHS